MTLPHNTTITIISTTTTNTITVTIVRATVHAALNPFPLLHVLVDAQIDGIVIQVHEHHSPRPLNALCLQKVTRVNSHQERNRGLSCASQQSNRLESVVKAPS